MSGNRQRNEEIVRLLNQGVPVKEVALQFGLSVGGIKRIQDEAKAAAKRGEQAIKAREQSVSANSSTSGGRSQKTVPIISSP